MVDRSQNGWPVVGPDKINKTPINGHVYPNGFLKGDVYKAFVWLFTQLDRRVERVTLGKPADEWGYYVKKIEGSGTISNHASGTAGDYNATEHVMGVRNTYTTQQRNEIHKILIEAHGIFRWGGDYTGRPDDMHFEIIKGLDQVKSFADSLTPQRPYIMSVNLDNYWLPSLKMGDNDDEMAGGDYVRRAQVLLNRVGNAGLIVDGDYGPKMAAAVAKLNTHTNGKTILIGEWVHLLGLIKQPSGGI